MHFHEIEIPIAISMIELAERVDHPFQRYFCYWAAFNNIYTLVAKRRGMMVGLELDRHGQPKYETRWTYNFPKVKTPKEHEQLLETIQQLDSQTKNDLISHKNFHFFVYRIPKGVHSKNDSHGQEINGVLNVTRTVNPQSPVWSPIDRQAYERYITGDHSDQDILAEQLVFMLYTVRNNLLHGSKSPGEENDIDVVVNALPLLEFLVRAFL
jgi:hypothetical protein